MRMRKAAKQRRGMPGTVASPATSTPTTALVPTTPKYVFKHGPVDGRDSGLVNGRVLQFTKTSKSSRLMITYNDNLRVLGNGKACRWMVKLDGGDCKTGTIAEDFYVTGVNNDHNPHVLLGYCDGVAVGYHHLQVMVMQAPGYSGSDCYTG